MSEVFDCTLRDSSYVVDFMLDLDTTRSITAGLSELGVSYIEVGHGMGLGGARIHGKAAGATDAEYLEAALSSAKGDSKVGCFLIAGVATIEEIDECARGGADFIRVGITENDIAAGLSVVGRLQDCDLEVFPFLMASSVWPRSKIERVTEGLKAFKTAACFYVDSAGYLFGARATSALTNFTGHWPAQRGFHGHNNLQSAVANCLTAEQLGYAFVDGTLGGFGRSGGNAPTEVLLCQLALDKPEHMAKAIALAEEFSHRVGQSYDFWDVALGLTGTHSRYLGALLATGRSREDIFLDLYTERRRQVLADGDARP
jgi:4-hydroxy-2-oxovalerate aldolase